MEQDWVLEALGAAMGRKTADRIVSGMIESAYPVDQLIQYSFHPDPQIAFRAAWIMEHLEEQAPGVFLPVIDTFLSAYTRQQIPACRRHYAKLVAGFSSLSSKNPYRAFMEAYDAETLVNTTFEWLIADDSPVAVQANCIDVLSNLGHRYPWVHDELRSHIPFLMLNGSMALQTRGRKVLARIGK